MSMNTPKTVSVTELRNKTKAVLHTVMTSDDPIYILYHSKMPVCLIKSEALGKYSNIPTRSNRKLSQYAGFLKKSKAFSGDAVKYQRKLREKWD